MELIVSVAAMMAEEPYKLLIVDSITANLRVDFSGRGELAERQQKLGQMMSRLRKVRERLRPSVHHQIDGLQARLNGILGCCGAVQCSVAQHLHLTWQSCFAACTICHCICSIYWFWS